jgi:predicted nucleic acid-binding protein
MIPYCETSFFVQSLLPGDFQVEAERIATEIGNEFGFVPVSALARFEVIQALRFEAWRFRNDRNKGFSPTQIEAALNSFLADFGVSFQPIPINWEAALIEAERLTRTTPEKGWRSMDLLHVGVAITAGVQEFYSFDQKQNDLAASQGLTTPLRRIIAP